MGGDDHPARRRRRTAPNQAATFTWNGATGNWSVGANWTGGVTPPGTDSTAILQFNGSGSLSYTATDDIVPTTPIFLVNQLQLNSSSSATNTLSGNQLQFTGTSPTLVQSGSGALVINNALDLSVTTLINGTGTGPLTLGGVISDAGGLTFSGAFNTTLTAANTYEGGTVLTSGTLTVSGSGTLGGSSGYEAFNTVMVTGGTLNINTNQNVGHFSGNGGTVNIASGVNLALVENFVSASYSGLIAGSGSVSMGGNGDADLTFATANSFSGGLTLNAGGLIGTSQASGSPFGTGNITLNGGTLYLDSATGAVGATTSGNLIAAGAGTIEVNASFPNVATTFTANNLVRSGTGTLIDSTVLTSTQSIAFTSPTFAGSIVPWLTGYATSNDGTLQYLTISSNHLAYASTSSSTNINSGTSLTTPYLASSAHVNILSANQNWGSIQDNGSAISGSFTLTLGNGAGNPGGLILNSGANITTSALAFGTAEGIITPGGTSGSMISAPITGSGGITVGGQETVAFTSASNSFTGGLNLNGTVQASSDSNLGGSGGALNFNGGTLDATASFSTTRPITLGAAGGTLDAASSTTLSVSGTISGSGTLTITDSGTVVLSGTNNYTGGTIINDGSTVKISADANLGNASGPIIAATGGTLLVTSSFATSRNFAMYDPLSLNVATGVTLTLNGVIMGNGSFSLAGPGTTVVTGANTDGPGFGIEAGTLSVSADNNLGRSGAAITIQGAGTTLQVTGSFTTTRALNQYTSSTIDVTSGVTFTEAGVIADSTGTNSLIKTDSGTLVLSGVNTFGSTTVGTDAVNILGGTLSISADNNLGALGNALAFNGGALAVTNSLTTGRNASFSGTGDAINVSSGQTLTVSGVGVWSGTGSLALNGPGTVALDSSTGSYTGFSGNISLAGGTLEGNATLLSTITIGSGATLNPGISATTPGILHAVGVTLNLGSAINFNITNANTGGAGTTWNELVLSGNVTLNSSAVHAYTININGSLGTPSNFNAASTYTWDFATFASGSIQGSTFNSNEFLINSTFGNASAFTVIQDGTTALAIQYSAVPEPGSLLLSGLAALAMAAYGRHNLKRGTRLDRGAEI